MQPQRYLVHYTYIPDEALWATCQSHAELVDRVCEVWGSELKPVFKYFMPSHVERGFCEVLIDDEQDFAIWSLGRGTVAQPQPLTDSLFVFDKRRLPRARRIEERGGMYAFPTLGFPLMRETQTSISLRHSNSKDVVLYGRKDVIGDGCGDWGRLMIKAQRMWSVQRPVFRYYDEARSSDADPNGDAQDAVGSDGKGMSRKLIGIYNAEDFRLWSTYRREHNPELFVFEGAALLSDGGCALSSTYEHHEHVLPPSVTSSAMGDAERRTQEVDALRHQQADASNKTVSLVVQQQQQQQQQQASAKPLTVYERLVLSGQFGATFTTPCNKEGRQQLLNGAANRDAATSHHEALVARLTAARF